MRIFLGNTEFGRHRRIDVNRFSAVTARSAQSGREKEGVSTGWKKGYAEREDK